MSYNVYANGLMCLALDNIKIRISPVRKTRWYGFLFYLIMNELKERWISTLRMKAKEYEHPARKNGEIVTELSLDSLANEMEAFFVGLNK